MSESRTDTVVAWGDSQTAGFSWGNRLPLLSETITTAVGRGISGQEAGSVAVRQGGIVLTTTAQSAIPSTGEPVDIPVSSSVTPCNMRYGASDVPVILAGVRGVLTVIATANSNATSLWDRATGTGTLRFTPSKAPAAEVTVPSGTAFVSQDVADHPEWAECLTIIWVGGNDAAFAGESRVTGVTAAVTAMVNRLRATVDNPKFLVAGRTTGTTNTEGTSSWQTAVDQRDALAAAFPDNAIDIWGYVRDHGLDILGITPTPEDTAALAGKTVPPSLTTDGLHYSTQTRERVLAPFIINELADRGWTVPKKEIPPVAEYTPTNWKNKPSTETPLSAENLNNIETGIQAAAEASAAASQGVADLRETKAEKTDLTNLVTTDALTTGLAKKVDLKGETSKNTVYGISNGGSLFMYPTGVSTMASGSLVMRQSDGSIRVGDPSADDRAATKKYVDTAISGRAPANGTRAMLDAGTDTVVRGFSAKDIADYVAAKIAELAQPKA